MVRICNIEAIRIRCIRRRSCALPFVPPAVLGSSRRSCCNVGRRPLIQRHPFRSVVVLRDLVAVIEFNNRETSERCMGQMVKT